jgi:ABC-type transport system substrate-binding protein
VLAGAAGPAAERPRYGGTLRLELLSSFREILPSAMPADAADAAARSAVLPLVFETLARVDGAGGLEAALAESWQSDPQQKQWQFRLRRGVTLHDGTLLSATQVAAALRQMDAGWTVQETADGVRIESQQPLPDLPWDLADERRAIAVPGGGALPLGTGPFRVERWDPGRQLVLAAHDGYRAGRPFVDAVQIDMTRTSRDEVLDLEVGRADIISVPVQNARRVSDRGLRILATPPRELLVLVFDPRRPGGGNEMLRRALARAVDRTAICNVLLQRRAEPAAALLPRWLSGYGGLFTRRDDRAGARVIVASLQPGARALSIGFPAADPVAQAVADRVAVDGRDAGLTVTVAAARTPTLGGPDVHLVHAVLAVNTPDRALAVLAHTLGVGGGAVPAAGTPLDAVYRFEQSLLDRDLVVPLVHLPQLYGLSTRVETANGPLVRPSGALNLADAWLRTEKP